MAILIGNETIIVGTGSSHTEQVDQGSVIPRLPSRIPVKGIHRAMGHWELYLPVGMPVPMMSYPPKQDQ